MRKILVNNLLRAVEQHVLTAKRDVRREVSLERMQGGVDRSAMRFTSLVTSNEESPSTDLQRQERESVLAEVLAEMPADYRKLIHLRHMEGLSFSEVAIRMNRSSGAVRMLWLRALRRLRDEFAERGNQ